jgi:TetR/AcrR family tetracycline transcriptional repressor
LPKQPEFDLEVDEIVSAAVDIFHAEGLDAVSMRSVSARLGVSPVPLYSRVGNKEALVDAMADRLLADLAPPSNDDEPWTTYAARWARALRSRLYSARDSRLILASHREAYVEASRPLVEAMRNGGMAADAAVQACRLIMWATIGFGAVEGGAEPPGRPRSRARFGGDPGGVTKAEVDALFAIHIRYLIDGIAGDAAENRATTGRPRPARPAKPPRRGDR